VILVGALTSCSDSDSRAEIDPASLPSEERAFRGPDDFLGGYWLRPVPLQGAPPEGVSPLEASLEPATCGSCHAQQYEDWGATVHAGAFSPGLSGQLVNWESHDYETVRNCLSCHAPLSEQSAQVPDTTGALVANPLFDASLQRAGMVCAACHVRGWQRYGPPRRDGSLTAGPASAPHGGATRTSFFEDSRFCAGCHQFELPAPSGKSLQNTYAEWKASRYAEQGVGCQSCHMPDRRHQWRGVHDSATVRSGVTIEWLAHDDSSGAGQSVALRVTNSGTGHRFPTYVTPEVVVRIELLDSGGRAMVGASVEAAIRRSVDGRSGTWVELSDTRLAPDSSLILAARAEESGASFARGTVVVYPDAFYQRMFAGMLAGALSDTSEVLIAEAYRRASESSFTIFDDTVAVR
jgi:hypothetical protein